MKTSHASYFFWYLLIPRPRETPTHSITHICSGGKAIPFTDQSRLSFLENVRSMALKLRLYLTLSGTSVFVCVCIRVCTRVMHSCAKIGKVPLGIFTRWQRHGTFWVAVSTWESPSSFSWWLCPKPLCEHRDSFACLRLCGHIATSETPAAAAVFAKHKSLVIEASSHSDSLSSHKTQEAR